MPIFETTEPITLIVDLSVGEVRVTASDRGDAVVAVRPSNEFRASDIRAAEQTHVEFSNGTLLIQGPREWRRYAILSGNGSVDVSVELPSRSGIRGDTGMGRFDCDGELGRCDLKTGMGRIRLGQAGPIRAHTGYGDITVEQVLGDVEARTGSGDITIHAVDGSATIKNSDGNILVGEITGDLSVKAANGSISIGRTEASVTAKSANGNVRAGEVVRGSVVLETAAGNVAVGIPEGTAAWLDASTQYGKVRNSLNASEGPEGSKETVEVRARTSYGNIEINRSAANRTRSAST